MRVLIAGATGALGVPLVRLCIAEGYDVVGLARTARRKAAIEVLGAQAVVVDALDATSLRAAVGAARPDVVVQALTAIPARGPLRAADLTQTNALRNVGTANLLTAAIAAGAKRFVLESMVFIYGFGDLGPGPITEERGPADSVPHLWMEPSLRALANAEAQVLKVASAKYIEGVILRFGGFYGPSAGTDALARLLRWHLLPVPREARDRVAPWIHIEDAASAVVAAVRRGRSGEAYNIVDDEPAKFNDVMQFLANALGLPPPPSIPMWTMRFIAPFLAEAWLGATIRASNAKAKNELGWSPRYPTYREGLAAFCKLI